MKIAKSQSKLLIPYDAVQLKRLKLLLTVMRDQVALLEDPSAKSICHLEQRSVQSFAKMRF